MNDIFSRRVGVRVHGGVRGDAPKRAPHETPRGGATVRGAAVAVLCAWSCVSWGASAAPAAAGASAAHATSGAVRGAPAHAASVASGISTTSAASGASAAGPASAPVSASVGAGAWGAAAASSASAALAASEPPALTLPVHPVLTPEQAAEQTREALDMRKRFARVVDRRLRVPLAVQRAYGARLQDALDEKGLGALAGEFVILVDRSANVQALFIYFRALPDDPWLMIGASPVATGRPGEFDHFLTPLGVFEHSPQNMDFRAEGTMNQNNIRGYGRRDMRIYDLGWVDGERGWGKGGYSQMRFQMHATDPDRLEPLLGIRHSKGCVRIPATLNAFIDHYGIIDAEYQALVDEGKSLWVLHSDREITPWAGRFIVVIDSERKTRPAWSPVPGGKARAKVPAGADTAD
ncbi:L,D-transpeptidase [Paraburkholderia sp. JHI2823]|uniref:L,D-transpeptidase n=1 Tax=Paraburkholderia TaxID=1822464 RepID=UPI0012DF627C|nr:L,D-transpeptidase [Paraburkholderia mimosarum]